MPDFMYIDAFFGHKRLFQVWVVKCDTLELRSCPRPHVPEKTKERHIALRYFGVFEVRSLDDKFSDAQLDTEV